ncbi:hypothetical protein K9L27_02365 [Candidatus Gracilibacteria bacterium]|nr:hypothetical protein [Candidatus Gracilibacteria bacterium]
MDSQFEKRLHQQLSAEHGGKDALNEALLSGEKVSEVVSRLNGENASAVSTNGGFFDFSGISQKVSQLLFHREKKEIHLPPVGIQRKEVKHSLEHEEGLLLRQAKRIQNTKHFSAAALERVIQQIRYLRKLLSEILTLASDVIEKLYRQYVLRQS